MRKNEKVRENKKVRKNEKVYECKVKIRRERESVCEREREKKRERDRIQLGWRQIFKKEKKERKSFLKNFLTKSIPRKERKKKKV